MFTRHGGFDLLGDDAPDLADIAHALGMQCRFNGSIIAFYSVAQHCCKVSNLLKDWGYDHDVQLAGLLHDAGEFAIGDLTKPVQRAIDATEFKSLEAQILKRVYKVAGLEMNDRTSRLVKLADKDMLLVEMRSLIANDYGRIDYSELSGVAQGMSIEVHQCMKPDDASQLWLRYYCMIQEERAEGACVQ